MENERGQNFEDKAMCLTVPMQIESIDRLVAHCRARGVEREVSLLFLQDEELAPGDYVLVQLGTAVQRVTKEDAEASWALLDEVLAAQEPPSDDEFRG